MAEEYKIGNTQIIVHRRELTPEQQEIKNKRVSDIAWEIVLKAREQGIDI